MRSWSLLLIAIVSSACTSAQGPEAPTVVTDPKVRPAPPPPPEAPSLDPRFACSASSDCVASCMHGAVSRAWYDSTYPSGESCEDGCTSKGTEPPVCVDRGCVARRDGKDDPLCTRLDRPPVLPPEPPPGTGAPIVVERTGGFSQVERTEGAAAGLLRYSSPPGSACMVDVQWWRPMPPSPGGPMAEASRRAVTVDGVATDVITTSMFEGKAREVDAVFIGGKGYQIRVVFDACGSLEEDRFLEGLRVRG